MCLCVCTHLFSTRPSNCNLIWHACADRSGNHWKQIWPTPPQRGLRGVLGGSTIQKCRKCHELPRKSIKKITPTPREGVGGWVGGSFRGQKLGKYHELPRKLIHFVTPHPTHPGGGVLWDTISASSFEKYIRNIIILSDYTANIPGEAR